MVILPHGSHLGYPPEPRPLNPRQQSFVREYQIDLNGTQAAIRAGYSPNGADVQAVRLLGDARIQALIAGQREKRADRLEITADRIMQEYARIAFADVTDIAQVKQGHVQMADTATLPARANRRHIRNIRKQNRRFASQDAQQNVGAG